MHPAGRRRMRAGTVRSVAGDWVEFDDGPKRRVIRRRLGRLWPFVLAFGTASAFMSKGGPSPFQSFGWIAVPIWFAGWGLVLLAAWGVLHLVSRPFAIDRERGLVRIRGRVVPFSAVDSAELEPFTNLDPDLLSIRLGIRKRRTVVLVIREGREATVTGAHRDALLAALAGSSITRPSSVHDPTGRFARFNFPGSLDKAGAAEVVEHPPQVGVAGP